jgi:hypothetical protein
MDSATNHDPIGSLVLARLLAAGEKGESIAKVQKDLEPLLAHRDADPPLAPALGRAIEALKAAGLVDFLLGKSKKAAPRVVLTAEGRRHGLEFLGVAALRPRTTWAVIRKTYLPASVLGLPASGDAQFKAMSSDPTFQAVVLRRQYHLPIAEVPKKLDEAIDALAWKLIGFEGEIRKFDLKNVKTAVLNRALGDGRAADFKKAAGRLAAQKAGARRDDPKELRDAVVRDWVDRNSGLTAKDPEPTVRQVPAEPLVARDQGPGTKDPEELAARVQAAARDCPTGRYGDNKVFIVHVWRRLQADPDFADMGLDAFKEFLAAANNARLLDLSRADLVQAMDPDDVRLSEVRYLNTSFHFIRI